MSKQIWKYELEIADVAVITVPEESEFLCIKEQGNQLVAWVEVESECTKTMDIPFLIRGTGEEFDGTEGHYLDTIVMSDGFYVWHIYTDIF